MNFFWSLFPTKRSTRTLQKKILRKFRAKFGAKFGMKTRKIRSLCKVSDLTISWKGAKGIPAKGIPAKGIGKTHRKVMNVSLFSGCFQGIFSVLFPETTFLSKTLGSGSAVLRSTWTKMPQISGVFAVGRLHVLDERAIIILAYEV